GEVEMAMARSQFESMFPSKEMKRFDPVELEVTGPGQPSPIPWMLVEKVLNSRSFIIRIMDDTGKNTVRTFDVPGAHVIYTKFGVDRYLNTRIALIDSDPISVIVYNDRGMKVAEHLIRSEVDGRERTWNLLGGRHETAPGAVWFYLEWVRSNRKTSRLF